MAKPADIPHNQETTVRSIAAIVLALMSTSAMAKPYVRGALGINIDSPAHRDYQRKNFLTRITNDSNGISADLALGLPVAPRLRAELDAVFTRIPIGNAGCPTDECAVTGNVGANGIRNNFEHSAGGTTIGVGTVNLIYDLPITPRLSVSAGGGIGGAYYDTTAHMVYRQEGDGFHFAWKALAEVNYRVSPHVSLTARYARDDLGDVSTKLQSNGRVTVSTFNHHVAVQNMTFGVTYNF